MLDEWTRVPIPAKDGVEQFGAMRITNAGPGSVVYGYVYCWDEHTDEAGDFGAYSMSQRFGIIGPGQSIPIGLSSQLFWKCVKRAYPREFPSVARLKFVIRYMDTIGNVHQTESYIEVHEGYAHKGSKEYQQIESYIGKVSVEDLNIYVKKVVVRKLPFSKWTKKGNLSRIHFFNDSIRDI